MSKEKQMFGKYCKKKKNGRKKLKSTCTIIVKFVFFSYSVDYNIIRFSWDQIKTANLNIAVSLI